ncbi:MAG: recombination regulator RecX [Piscinibacter sp.]|nr:recombination regulator RecX [Piscinibacter sp.]
MAEAAPQRSLKGRALQWLAQREHSRAELRRKLLPHARALAALGEEGEAPAQVDALLDWLEANRYLSEQRFVEARVSARAARYGNRRIEQELAQHGVALDGDAARELAASEQERAREVWRRKFGQAAADAAGRVRQARFLTARGFSAEVVRQVLRQAGPGGLVEDDGQDRGA